MGIPVMDPEAAIGLTTSDGAKVLGGTMGESYRVVINHGTNSTTYYQTELLSLAISEARKLIQSGLDASRVELFGRSPVTGLWYSIGGTGHLDMKRDFTKLEVGKPFPGPVPMAEGVHMELWDNSLNVLIQKPGLGRDELRAFKKGLKRYAYLESNTPAPIAYWIFDFADPHGPVGCNFNVRVVILEYLRTYLDTSDGIKNVVCFYLLDGQILKAMRLVGLDPEAVNLFHETINKQLETNYSQTDYDRYLAALGDYTVQELFQKGKAFHQRK